MDPDHIPTSPATLDTTNEDQNSKTSIEEAEQSSNEMGSGRSYECVFCKRGFTTAQALGGHMNIHRKDRVKTKPSTPSKPEPFSHHHSTLRPTMTTTATTISHHQSFQTYFPTSSTWCLGTTTATTPPPHDHQFSYVHNSNNPQVLNTFKDQNWTTTNMSLASQSLPTLSSTDRHDKRSDGNGGDDDDDNDDELDLELRLGHDR